VHDIRALPLVCVQVAVAIAWSINFVVGNTMLVLAGVDLVPWFNIVLVLGVAVSYEHARCVLAAKCPSFFYV